MFSTISEKFSEIFSSLTGSSGLISEKNIETIAQRMFHALIDADVPYEAAEAFIHDVKQATIGSKRTGQLLPGEQFTKLVYDRMVDFLGGSQLKEPYSFQFPAIIMFCGLQGSGKTTSVAKVAHELLAQAQKRGKTRKILAASVDFYRPAALEQLEILARTVGIDFYRATAQNPVEAAQEIKSYFLEKQYDLLLLDTAGRLHIDHAMIDEIKRIDTYLKPKYKILVIDAMTGQESLNISKTFDAALSVTGALFSKLDSDTKGGSAFAFRYVTKKPILFVGTGEKIADLAPFQPQRMATRMIGMGDLATLLEQADQKIKRSEQERMYQQFTQGTFTFQDFIEQIDAINRLGSMGSLLQYLPKIPGMKITPDMVSQGEADMQRFKAIIGSMTPRERKFPKLLNPARCARIARGAGVSSLAVSQLLARFEQSQQFAKLFKKMVRL